MVTNARPQLPLRRFLKRLNPPARLWYYSCKAYQARLYPVAWILKILNFVLFKGIFCFECRIENDLEIVHFGLGCVVHPNVTIGHRVRMFQHVSLAAETFIGSPNRIVIEDDVVLGAHCMIIGNDINGIRIGRGAIIGAGAIVTRDVAPGVTIVPVPSRPVKLEAKP